MPKTPRRPFVLLNMAVTADGKINNSRRNIVGFGSPRDLHHLYAVRATADAILCGARTVEESHATLGNGGDRFLRARLKKGRSAYPLRVLVSGSGSISLRAEIWQQRFSPLIVLTSREAPKKNLSLLKDLADHVWVSNGPEVDLAGALSRLHSDFGIRRLVAEGGGELNDSLLRAGLVDELHLTVCPYLFGGRSAPTMVEGTGFSSLAMAAQLELKTLRRSADELFLVFRVKRATPNLRRRARSSERL